MTKTLDEALAALPPIWSEELLGDIQKQLETLDQTIVVLDDDPTGTQTVSNVPVLTTWSVDVLAAEFNARTPIMFVLTNSRAENADAARTLATEIGDNLAVASRKTKREFVVISRSDSTLRGHYPIEVSALTTALGQPDAPHVIVPFFLEGGRYTIENTHYVAEGESLIPAAETPFAKDAAFGYTNSNLISWVAEKFTQASLEPPRTESISLDELRVQGPEHVAGRLRSLPAGSACVVNAASTRDVEVFTLAAIEAMQSGQQLLFRTAAGVVRSFAGQAARPLLAAADMVDPAAQAGLVVVGSYVPKTSRQLDRLLSAADTNGIEVELVTLNVNDLLSGDKRYAVANAAEAVAAAISAGRNAVLATSRDLVVGADACESLEIGNAVSSALVDVVRSVIIPLRFLIAKGGITSSDVATEALNIRRATVLGQIVPGVPVWKCGPETSRPGLSYVVFPGNVGSDDELLASVAKLAG